MTDGQVTGANHAVLDPVAVEGLREIVGGDPELLQEIVGAFLEDVPDRLDEIRRGLAGSDPTLVRRAAHTLKSNALTFGALSLADAARRLEEAARDDSLEGGPALASEIDRELAVARPQIESLTT